MSPPLEAEAEELVEGCKRGAVSLLVRFLCQIQAKRSEKSNIRGEEAYRTTA